MQAIGQQLTDTYNFFSNIPQRISQYFPTLLTLDSIKSFLYDKVLLLTNFFLQSIFFSVSITSILSAFLILIGLTQASSILYNKYTFLVLTVALLCLNFIEFGDKHWVMHELFGYISGFYVAVYVVEGCVYVKDKLDGTGDLYDRQLRNKKNDNEQGRVQINQAKMENPYSMSHQIYLMVFTALTIMFYLFLFYHIKISNQIRMLHNNYRMLAIVSICTFSVYTVSLAKKITLFLPALVTVLVIYMPILLKVLLVSEVYPSYKLLAEFNMPLHMFFVIVVAVEGKQKHIRQSVLETRENYHIEDGGYGYDKQYINDKIKNQRMLIESMFWGAMGYYLYTMLHGNNKIWLQYMVVPIFCLQALRGMIK